MKASLIKFREFEYGPDMEAMRREVGEPSGKMVYPCLNVGDRYFVMINRHSQYGKGLMFVGKKGSTGSMKWEFSQVGIEDIMDDLELEIDNNKMDEIIRFVDMAKQGDKDVLMDYFDISTTTLEASEIDGEILEEIRQNLADVLDGFKNQGTTKPGVAHVPPAITIWAAHAMDFDAERYGRDNWKKCTDVKGYESALLRHIYAVLDGERFDAESGLHHYSHAAAYLAFLIWFESQAGDIWHDL